MSEPREILKRARKRIEDPKRWTQDWFARDAEGKSLVWGSPEGYKAAVCWCASAAIQAESPDREAWIGAASLLRRVISEPVADFNDSHTHEQVLEAFDQAIAA